MNAVARALIVVLCSACAAAAPAREELRPPLPDAYRIVASLDAADGNALSATQAPLSLARGSVRRLACEGGAAHAVFADAEMAVVSVSELQRGKAYAIAFSWWDADARGRVQSVRWRSDAAQAWAAALPAAPAAAYHAGHSTYARVALPLPDAFVETGRCEIAFAREAGPDAVASAVWLLERNDAPAKPRVLIVMGDDYEGHRWRETGPAYADILREDPRIEVWMPESPAILGSPALEHFDAVMLHFKNYPDRLPLGPEVWDGLERFAASGKGVIVPHFGCGAFEDWPGYGAIAGRVWNPKGPQHDPYGSFPVRVRNAAHAITQGLADFDTRDELYTCLVGEAPIDVLCDAVSKLDKRPHPMAFVLEKPGARVFHCTLGHDVAALRAEGVRMLYRRGVLWAAGL